VDNGAAGNARELAGVAREESFRAAAFQTRGPRQSEVDASTLRGATPWRSCTRRELTSGARSGVRATIGDGALPPVGHVDELRLDSEEMMLA